MEIVVVAGGRGVRMGSVTDELPKPMLPVAGKPLLEHLLGWVKAAGFSQAHLCLGYKAEAVKAHFDDGSRLGLRLQYHVEVEPRGTAGSVFDLGLHERGDLLIVYGDLFLELDCRALLDFHARHDAAATLVARASDHPLDSDLLRVKGDQVTGIYRAKAGEPYENLAAAAVWVVRPALMRRVPRSGVVDFGRQVFPEALAAGERLAAYRTKELVADIGTPERLAAFEKTFEARRR